MLPAGNVSRRQFHHAIAVTSFAFPTIVPGSVFGDDSKAPPSERITIGYIGCGRMANDYHLPELLKFDDVQAVAVCEVDLHAPRARQESCGEGLQRAEENRVQGCAAYNDFRDLVARKDIDAVCIATPEHWHAIQAIEAIKAGKDVYCEKPLTLTLAEAKRCIDAARKYERIFQVGSQQRSDVFGSFREAAEFIRSGRLGEILTVTVGVGGPSRWCDLPAETMEPGLDWDLWLGPRRCARTTRSSAREECTSIFPPGASFASMPAGAIRHGSAPLRHRAVVPEYGRVGPDRDRAPHENNAAH